MSRRDAPSPPSLAQALVRILAAAENRTFLAADLAEEFDELAATVGAAAARRWYWKQVCLSAPPLIRQRVTTLDRIANDVGRAGSAHGENVHGLDHRSAVRVAYEPPGSGRHDLRHACHRAGHRRQHRDLQRDGGRVPPSTAVPLARSAGPLQHDGRRISDACRR